MLCQASTQQISHSLLALVNPQSTSLMWIQDTWMYLLEQPPLLCTSKRPSSFRMMTLELFQCISQRLKLMKITTPCKTGTSWNWRATSSIFSNFTADYLTQLQPRVLTYTSRTRGSRHCLLRTTSRLEICHLQASIKTLRKSVHKSVQWRLSEIFSQLTSFWKTNFQIIITSQSKDQKVALRIGLRHLLRHNKTSG